MSSSTGQDLESIIPMLVYGDYQQNYGAGICPHFLESPDCFDYRIKIHVLVELNYPKVKLKCLINFLY